MALFKQDDPAVAAEKARIKAQQEAEKQAQRTEAERKRREATFRASPQGQARAAYERGDMLFQFSSDLSNIQGTIATLAAPISSPGAYSRRRDHMPTDILNAICNEGWELHSLSTAFIPTTEISRDKFLSSGQQTAISGQLVGTYVFIRVDDDGESTPATSAAKSALQSKPKSTIGVNAADAEVAEAEAEAAEAEADAARARVELLRQRVGDTKPSSD